MQSLLPFLHSSPQITPTESSSKTFSKVNSFLNQDKLQKFKYERNIFSLNHTKRTH